MRLLRGAADAQCVKARCPDFPLWSLRIVRPEHDSAPTVSSEGAGAEKGEKAVVRSKVNRRHRLSLEDQLKGCGLRFVAFLKAETAARFAAYREALKLDADAAVRQLLGDAGLLEKQSTSDRKCRGLNGLFRSQTVANSEVRVWRQEFRSAS